MALRKARSAKSALKEFPGRVPNTLDDAYILQHFSIAAWPDKVAGWKVGGVPTMFREAFRAERLAGPIFSSQIAKLPANGPIQMPVFRDGFAAIEPEFILELGDVSQVDIEAATPGSVADVIHRCFIGIEVASSPVPDINDYGPAAIISDFGNNHGLVVGNEINEWSSSSLAQIKVSTTINGQCVGESTTAAGLDGPLGAVLFLIMQLRAMNHPIPEGLLVSTGAITGVHEASIGSTAQVSFAGHGEIELEMVDAA